MNKIAILLKKGWIIDEIRFDRSQNWHYVHAIHETQEANAIGASGESLTEAIDQMYQLAVTSTPQWYLDNIKAHGN